MIQKLRRKFIATNMLLVSLVLLAVFSVQLLSAYRQAADRVFQAQAMALEWISHSLTSPSFVFDRPHPDGMGQPEKRRWAEQDFPGIPAFAVEIDQAGRVIALRTGPGVEVTDETAQAMAGEALAKDTDHGTLIGQELSYLRLQENGRRFLAFADNSSIDLSLRRQALFSVCICAAALLAFYLISRVLARLSLRPVERAWEQQRQFVADASHELKTPLAVILANTDIVLSHPGDTVAEQQKWIGYIKEEAQRMRALVEDLLFLAKSDAAKSPRPSAPVRLSELVTASLLPFESVAFEAGVELSAHIAPGLTLTGDEAQLRRLTVILLDNAVKYAGAEGRVSVTLDQYQDRPRLMVHNTGVPIPAEHLPYLFERFYRSDTARDREQGGYGLGLAIARSIAEAHGGRISVSSTPEAGTTFTVIFGKK